MTDPLLRYYHSRPGHTLFGTLRSLLSLPSRSRRTGLSILVLRTTVFSVAAEPAPWSFGVSQLAWMLGPSHTISSH